MLKGDTKIDGIPGSGAPIVVKTLGAVGNICGSMLPTGNIVDSLILESGKEVKVSCIDVSRPMVFLHAQDVGSTCTETKAELDKNIELQALLESIRLQAAKAMGMGDCSG
jgi:4-oxalomesaconate tautomerase